MEKLCKIIKEKGEALNNNVLKVDSFLNIQVDPNLMKEIGVEFKEYFKAHNITKVATIESSGIAPALMTALELEVELIILKKNTSKILNSDIISTKIHSYTKGTDYDLVLKNKYINEEDNVLIIDDFLANGEAALGAARLIEMAKAKVGGIGIVIEKSFQPGAKMLNEKGYDVYSLAKISKLDKGIIEFKK